MTRHLAAPPRKPLPVIVQPIVDEILSSWLARTAHIYSASGQDILTHFGIDPPDSSRDIDFSQPPEVRARLAWGFRTTAARIHRAGHPVSIRRSKELIGIAVPFSRCRDCNKRSRAGSEIQPISRSWYEAWRVSCGFCRRPFHIGSAFADRTKGIPLVPDGLWSDAVDGSKLFERYLVGRPCGWLPPRLIWTLASTPIRSRSHARVAFGLIAPEASHPAYGTLHQSPSRTCRTRNPFKRLALMAALHRFDQKPHEWLQAFSGAATESGRAAISKLLHELPDGIGHKLLRRNPGNTTLRRDMLYACQAVELGEIRLKLAANLRRTEEFCRMINDYRSAASADSRL
jgi:hypothetical protein